MRWQSLLRYTLKRLLMSLLVIFLVSVIIFVIVRLSPGDPVKNRIGPYGDYSAENVAKVEAELGLDKSYPEQYLIWAGNCLKGDLGVSLRNGVNITPIIFQKFKVSLELIVVSIIIAALLSIPLGIYTGVKPGSIGDKILSVFSSSFLAMPSFCVGLLLIVLFGVKLHILPTNGYIPFSDNPALNLKYLIMPAITESLFLMASLTRYVRSETIEVTSSNYIRTAVAKGMPQNIINFRHILKNISTTTINILGMEFASMLGGTVIIEQLFGWSGLGWYIANSIQTQDYPAVQGAVLIIAIGFVLVNLVVDILYAIIDPRVELE